MMLAETHSMHPVIRHDPRFRHSPPGSVANLMSSRWSRSSSDEG